MQYPCSRLVITTSKNHPEAEVVVDAKNFSPLHDKLGTLLAEDGTTILCYVKPAGHNMKARLDRMQAEINLKKIDEVMIGLVQLQRSLEKALILKHFCAHLVLFQDIGSFHEFLWSVVPTEVKIDFFAETGVDGLVQIMANSSMTWTSSSISY